MDDGSRRPDKYANQTILGHKTSPVARPEKIIHKKHGRKIITKRIIILSAGVCTVLVLAVGTALLMTHSGKSPNALPGTALTAKQDFKVYYYKNDTPPSGLMLQAGTAIYDDETLIFNLTNSSGQKLSISEQKLPAEFANSVLQGTEAFTTNYGKGTLSNLTSGRTTGSLTTKDGTLILLNTSDPFDTDVIKSTLRSLAPIQ